VAKVAQDNKSKSAKSTHTSSSQQMIHPVPPASHIGKTKPESTSPKANWGPAATITVTVVLFFLGQVVGALLASIYPRLKGWTPQHRQDWLSQTVIGQFWFVLIVEALTLAGVIWFVKRRRGTWAQLGIGKPKWLDIGYAGIGFLAYVIALEVVIGLIIKPFVPGINIEQQQDIGFNTVVGHRDLLLAFLSLVILPPIVEEIMFRGFLYSGLKRAMPVFRAAIFTSLLFAAPHLLESNNGKLLWIAGIDTFVLSLVLVFVRQKTGRLYAGMLVHAAKNYLAFSFLYHISLFAR
jgi:membrane protease YdiL (CAAX protease family)